MFAEDLDFFLEDFGEPVQAGAIQGLGILNLPGVVIIDGNVINSADYSVKLRRDQFSTLTFGDPITVAGVPYTVREPMPVGDGMFMMVSLERSSMIGVGALLLEEGGYLLLEEGGRLLLEV